MALLGEPVTAPKAVDIGLINAAWPDDEFADARRRPARAAQQRPDPVLRGQQARAQPLALLPDARAPRARGRDPGRARRLAGTSRGRRRLPGEAQGRLHRRVKFKIFISNGPVVPPQPSMTATGGVRCPSRPPAPRQPAHGGGIARRTVMGMTTEKVAVVTGAGSGLGRLITIALADQGWYVVAAGRRFALLEDTVAAGAAGDGPPGAGRRRRRGLGGGAVRDRARPLRPARPARQQRGHRRAGRRGGRAEPRGLAVDRGHQPHRLVPVRAPRGRG